MTMKILGGLGIVVVAGLIALSARDSFSREAASRRARAATPVLNSPEQSGRTSLRAAAPNTAAVVDIDKAPAPLTSPQASAPASEGPNQPESAAAASDQGSADAILTRAAAAYGKVRSLRADFTQVTRNPLLGSTTTSRGTLFQRRPDRLLLRFAQPKGDMLVSDGEHFWVYYPSVDPKQVIRMPAARGSGALDLQAQFLGDPVRRFQATLLPTESVGGRPANVLRLVPRAAAPYKELKVWLDRGDNLARRFEITESNDAVRRFELSGLRVNTPLSDALFRFQPPAGAHVVDQG